LTLAVLQFLSVLQVFDLKLNIKSFFFMTELITVILNLKLFQIPIE
jgi:hypothetical protein